MEIIKCFRELRKIPKKSKKVIALDGVNVPIYIKELYERIVEISGKKQKKGDGGERVGFGDVAIRSNSLVNEILRTKGINFIRDSERIEVF